MSESLRELERVKESLMAARRAVVIAHGMTEDLHSGVDGAGKSLAESEAMRRYATVAGEGAAAYFDSAATEMVQVERFCDGAAMVGVQISTELKERSSRSPGCAVRKTASATSTPTRPWRR